jgi:hypothetical protein
MTSSGMWWRMVGSIPSQRPSVASYC